MLKFSSYTEAFDELLENEGLKKKAAKSGISYGTLKKVYNRGMAAWRTGHRPGTTPQQWGMARVNSYITKGKGTYYGADSDLSGKGKKKAKKEGYVSYAQQKAAHASMAERGKKKKNEADDYHYSTGERIKKKPVKKEAMSDAEKAAHQKAIDAFKAKGGKIKKLAPGYAQGYHGKSDPAAGMKGMMDKGDTKAMGTRKKIGSMK
jgi:hypothetical protein